MLCPVTLALVGLTFAADSKDCTGSISDCASGKNCLDISVGGASKEVCIKCEVTHVPIDGACEAVASAGTKCTPPATPDGTCQSCDDGHQLYSGGCYTACPERTYADPATSQCKACEALCLTCEASTAGSRCIKCEATHVPIEGKCEEKSGQSTVCTPPDAPDGTCKACLGDVFLYKGGCYTACPEGSANPDTHLCDSIPTPSCEVPNCAACSKDRKTCEACQNGHFLTPEKNACLSSCPPGSYATGQTCAPCDPVCAECDGAGANKCTSCPARKMLRYADEANPKDGTCVGECTEGSDCEACGLNVGGTKYCSKCKGTSVPLNGVCASNTARKQFCVTSANGACSQCASGYFLQEGGCYETKRLPGKSICTTENGGKCTVCANGLTVVGDFCPLCDPTCATCTEANQAVKCATCPPGYYLDANKACKPCTETSGSIQGVSNCMSCAPPASGSGLVTCYVTGSSTGGSTNKSALSGGAIAGIVIAVVVVVGGLVGFLCWWFVCRGK